MYFLFTVEPTNGRAGSEILRCRMANLIRTLPADWLKWTRGGLPNYMKELLTRTKRSRPSGTQEYRSQTFRDSREITG